MIKTVALLYQDKKQGLKFLEDSILKGQQYTYNKTNESARVAYSEDDIVEYILCKCDMQSVMDRFCGYHLSNYIVTDPNEYYHGEPLMFIVSRIRSVV